jgi:hypothetical protein
MKFYQGFGFCIKIVSARNCGLHLKLDLEASNTLFLQVI